MGKGRKPKSAIDQSQRCHYCSQPGTTWDHVVPKSLGGRNARFNLVRSCEPCNYAKGSAMPTCGCDHCRRAVVMWRNVSAQDLVLMAVIMHRVDEKLKRERRIVERLRHRRQRELMGENE